MKKSMILAATGMLTVASICSMTACGSTAAPETTAQTEAAVVETAAPETAAPETAAPEATVVEADAIEYKQEAISSYQLSSTDGSMTVTVPDEEWAEANTDEYCVAFSNGTSAVLMDHYVNGKEQVEFATGEANIPYAYETLITSGDYIVQIVGYATTEEEFDDVMDIIKSATVDMTKLHDENTGSVTENTGKNNTNAKEKKEDTHKVDPDVYSVEDVELKKYCNVTNLTVRSSGTTNSEPLGSYTSGNEIYVTGIVKKNGEANGWLRVNYGGETGYVYGAYTTDNYTGPTHTGRVINVWKGDGTVFPLVEYTDGSWRDADGNIYTKVAMHSWQAPDGTQVSEYEEHDDPQPSPQGESHTVKVDKGYLALRSYPSSEDAAECGELYTGDEFLVISTGNGENKAYAYGYCPKYGINGYVNANYLIW